MRNRNAKGFTLIELLIVVAIIGIIAAIAIPNLLNAIDRGKQKRTMADMRSIGTAVESYAIDVNRYPNGASLAAIETVIEPLYIKVLPMTDGWQGTMSYTSTNNASGYTVASAGKGGAFGGIVGNGGATQNFSDDIVFINGQFVQWPEGQQQ
jgi:general secretion pathway protein G